MKATPKQWDEAGSFASDTRACLLELRTRVEALEAGATCPHVVTSDEGTSYCRLAEQRPATSPTSSLVERVVMVIGRDREPARWNEARAAIREVATWLDAEAHKRGLYSHNGAYSATEWLRGALE